MIFNNREHEERFEELKKKSGCTYSDKERLALFHVISGVPDLYFKVNQIYDFENNKIMLTFTNDGEPITNELCLCSSANALLKLGIQLYNGCGSQNINDTFKYLDYDNVILALNSITVRYK